MKNGVTLSEHVTEGEEAQSTSPVPIEVVAELVALGLQTEAGDNLWRGFCMGRGLFGPMRLGIESIHAVVAPRPEPTARSEV